MCYCVLFCFLSGSQIIRCQKCEGLRHNIQCVYYTLNYCYISSIYTLLLTNSEVDCNNTVQWSDDLWSRSEKINETDGCCWKDFISYRNTGVYYWVFTWSLQQLAGCSAPLWKNEAMHRFAGWDKLLW